MLRRSFPLLLVLCASLASSRTTLATDMSLAGTVLRVGGAAFPGAEVVARPVPSNHDAHGALLDQQPLPVHARTTTDGAGRFVWNDLDAGVFELEVRADGFVPMRYGMAAFANPRNVPPVRLRPSVTATFTVIDGAGQPMAGVGVRATSADPQLWDDALDAGAWRPAPRVGWSDEQGRVLLPRLHGERLTVRLRRPGFVGATRVEATRQGTLVFADAPEKATTYTVLVRDADGEPHAGLVVAAGEGAWPLGRASADGRLDVVGRLTEPTKLWVFSEDGRTRTVSLPASRVENAAVIEARLAPLVSVQGQVVDDKGHPLPGALVWPGHAPGAFVRADDHGRFALRVPGRDRSRLQAHATGFLPRSAVFPAVIGADGVAPRVDITMVPAAVARGRIVDPDEQALAGVRVVARPEVPDVRPAAVRDDAPDSRAITDADGRFALAGLAPGTVYKVHAGRAGYAPTEQALPALVPGETRDVLAWTLTPGRVAFGAVRDAADQPIEGVEVQVTIASGVPRPPGAPTTARALTDAEGQFRLHAPPVSKVDIETRGGLYAPMAVRGLRLPDSAAPADLGLLVLVPGASIAGSVRGPRGEPVVDATVRARPADLVGGNADSTIASAVDDMIVTDDRGWFQIDGLPFDEPLDVVVRAPGFLPLTLREIRVPTGDAGESIDARLARAGRVAGVVVDDRGAPVAAAQVSLATDAPASIADDGGPRADTSRAVMTDDAGAFTIDDAVPGWIQLEAVAPGFSAVRSERVELMPEAPWDTVRLVLRPGATLIGRAVDAAGQAIAGARVMAGGKRDVVGADGRFEISGLALGTLSVVATAPGFEPTSRSLEVVDTEQYEVELMLAGGPAVSGRVVDAQGVPLAGAELSLERDDRADDGNTPEAVRSQTDGRFRFANVAPGEYRVHPALRGYVAARDAPQVVVDKTAVEGVTVTLRAGAVIAGDILGLEFDDLARVEVWAIDGDRHRQPGEVDFEGRYRVEDLAPRDWTVEAMVRGGERAARARVRIEPDAAEVERDLEFGGGVTVTGVVLLRGEPVPDTVVTLTGRTVPVARTVRTDAEGRFRMDDMDPDRYSVGLAHQAKRLAQSAEIDLLEDRDVVLEFRTARVTGRVVDAETGESLDAARLLLRPTSAMGDGSVFGGSSGDDGGFSFDNVAAGAYRLETVLQGFQPAEQVVEILSGAHQRGLEVALLRAEGLSVTVQRASGARPTFIILHGVDDQGRSYSETRPTDDAGQAHFDTLPAGNWVLTVGGTGAAAVETRVRVPGDPLALVLPDAGRMQVRVPALLETERFASLRIVSQDGRPFQNLRWGGVLERDWSLVAGQAVVEGVPPGTWQLHVQAPDGQIWTGSAVTTGGPDVEVRLD